MAKKEYDTSLEFTEDWYDVLEFINSDRVRHWFNETDEHGVNTLPQLDKLIKAANKIEKEFDKLN